MVDALVGGEQLASSRKNYFRLANPLVGNGFVGASLLPSMRRRLHDIVPGLLFAAVTWQSHSLANGALVLAATGRIDMTLAAILTATLPDQLEKFLPLARHRGASHWLAFWMGAFAFAPSLIKTYLGKPRHGPGLILAAVLFGLVLGPLLHVFLDGCSSRGVPVLPFSRTRLRLSLYSTRNAQAGGLNFSEGFFLACLLGGCAFVWQSRWHL